MHIFSYIEENKVHEILRTFYIRDRQIISYRRQ